MLEADDRTSPEEYPDHVLVTEYEIMIAITTAIIEDRVRRASPAPIDHGAVTEAQIEAALSAKRHHSTLAQWLQMTHIGTAGARDIVRAALHSALSAVPLNTGEAVAVKAIDWQVNGGSSVWSGALIFNTYYVIYDEGNGHRCFRKQLLSEADEVEIAYHPSLDEAKAAAQSDFEARIRIALLPSTGAGEQ
jgi:hypothetical protein